MAVRLEHSGNAAGTTITTSITNASTTINIASATGWPNGSVGPFVVTLDAGTASEEKVLVLSRTGTSLTVSARGYDGTTATSHANGAAITHTFSATEADEANALTAQATTGGGMATLTGAQAMTNKTLSSPTNIIAHSAANAAARIALTPYLGMHVIEADTKTEYVWDGSAWKIAYHDWMNYPVAPTIGSNGANGTIGNGSIVARVQRRGRGVSCRILVAGGSTSTWGTGGAFITGAYPYAVDTAVELAGRLHNVKSWSGSAEVTGSAIRSASDRLDLYFGGAGFTGAFNGTTYSLEWTYETTA